MTPAEIIKGILDDCADRTLPIDGDKLVQSLRDNGWTFTPTHTATDRSPLQMLAILVEMVEMYCPSLANSGGVQMARAMCAGVNPLPDGDCALDIVRDLRRYLDRHDLTYSQDSTNLMNVGVRGLVNLAALAREAILPHLVARQSKEGT
jgi:hypothetical protein